MNWYIAVLKKYAVFSGRAGRREYWMFVLFNIIFSICASIIDRIIGTSNYSWGLIQLIYGLAVFIPSVAVGVRRLHDIGKSGWMILVGLIPIAGFIWLLILMILEGQPGQNQYGMNPNEEMVA